MEQNTDELSLKLEKSVHALFHRLYQKNKDPKSRTQGKILKSLYLNGPVSQKEMQEKLNIQPGSISEIINKLERKELVTRQPDAADHRRMILSLTEKGKADVEEYSRYYQDQAVSFFQILNDSDKQELERILQILLNQESEKNQNDATE